MRRAALLILVLLVLPFCGRAQYVDDVAYVPRSAPERAADDTRLGITPGAVPGSLDLHLPQGTEAVVLLNGRGDVELVLPSEQWDRLPVEQLRPGTWTLRATVHGRFLLRRFLVLGNGHSTWLPDPVRAAGPKMRR
ncbi:MAG: hypothetical protein R2817_01510 [Flavobacteriales bacterium]